MFHKQVQPNTNYSVQAATEPAEKEPGTYITAKDDTALLDKYEALHHDEWGWVTDIVRGPGDTSEGLGRP